MKIPFKINKILYLKLYGLILLYDGGKWSKNH